MNNPLNRSDTLSLERGITPSFTPWGGAFSAVFGFVVIVVWMVTQTIAALGYIGVTGAQLDWANPDKALTSGDPLSFALLAGAIAGTLLVFFFAWLKAPGHTFRYVGLKRVDPRTMAMALGATLLYIMAADGLSFYLERPIVVDFMESAYRSATILPLLWMAICLGAPIFEEILFRGFLIRGWQDSRLGPVGAVVLSSLLWTAIHIQYGWYELTQIFMLGLLFGWIRIKTDSIVPALACHFLVNMVATIETAIAVGQA